VWDHQAPERVALADVAAFVTENVYGVTLVIDDGLGDPRYHLSSSIKLLFKFEKISIDI
jgi:hypothetical protein